MIYEYECPDCDTRFEKVKHHSKSKEPENCIKCDTLAHRVMSLVRLTKVEKHEYNPGLGCVTKGKKHREEICKRRGLVEVGNEAKDNIHKDMAEQNKRVLSWDGVN